MAICDNCQRSFKSIQGLRGHQRMGCPREAQATSPKTGFPMLRDLLAHCESGDCPAHSEEWNQVKEKVVAAAYERMPAEVLFAKAQERGTLPKRLVINLSTGSVLSQ